MASSPQGLGRHGLLAEYSNEVVRIADPDGVVVWVSPAGHRLLGWTQEAIVARADAARYEAKRRGKDTVVSFGPGGGS